MWRKGEDVTLKGWRAQVAKLRLGKGGTSQKKIIATGRFNRQTLGGPSPR